MLLYFIANAHNIQSRSVLLLFFVFSTTSSVCLSCLCLIFFIISKSSYTIHIIFFLCICCDVDGYAGVFGWFSASRCYVVNIMISLVKREFLLKVEGIVRENSRLVDVDPQIHIKNRMLMMTMICGFNFWQITEKWEYLQEQNHLRIYMGSSFYCHATHQCARFSHTTPEKTHTLHLWKPLTSIRL